MNISILIASLVALVATLWIHPYMVKIAHIKNIVDNPDARKLQKRPVPVLGGAAVFFGMMAGIGITHIYADCSSLFIIVTAMMTLLYIGIIDDILDLSPRVRFLIEIVVVVMLIALTALVGVLAASFNEFISMLPKFNKELTRKLFKLQEMLPFLNLHMSPERMLQRMDSEKVVTFTTALMTGLSGILKRPMRILSAM